MTKESDVVRVLKPYLMAFPSCHVQEDTLIIYARALSRLSVSELEAAMSKLLDTLRYFPSVAEILEAARSIKVTADGSAVPAAAEAWGEIMQQARRNGMDRKWEFSCPEIEYTLKMFGGKQMICMMPESDAPTCRAQFMRMYNEICEKQKTERENNAVLDALPNARAKLAQGKIIQLADAKNIAEGAA